MTTTLDPTTESAPDEPHSSRWRRITPEHWALAALLAGTAVLYLVNLSANGWGNSFYSAAIQAGSDSWKAWFFGSSDAANSITVDKPPASLWIPAIFVRIFGLNSWSILVPEALMGVASVWLLYVLVRKHFGPIAALLAGATLALTPVAAMMFRFDNPEALLILLTIGAVWATTKAMADGRTRWLVLTGVLVGFAFLTKQLQAFLIVPPLAVAYFACGPGGWLRRTWQLLAGLGAMIAGAGWWVLTVELWPEDSRPYIGGSTNNSFWDLTFGYNGFGRLNGNEKGSVRPGQGGGELPPGLELMGAGGRGGMSDGRGFFRMFAMEQGGQIAWLIPTALILGLLGIALRGKVPRHDFKRGFYVLCLLWLLVTMVVFSYMQGIFHAYYTAALAPAIGALIGAGAIDCWRARDRWWVRSVTAAAVLTAGVMAYVLLNRTPEFVPWLRYVVIVAAALAALGLALRPSGRIAIIAAGVATVMGLAGPAAYAIDTVSTAKAGAIPSAGPGGAGGFGREFEGGRGLMIIGQVPRGATLQFGPGGRQNGNGRDSSGASGASGAAENAAGGLLNGSNPSARVTDLLKQNAGSYTWVAAAIGSNSASGFQLASQQPVMPIGGFNGSDPSPTLAQFQKYVREGKIHYFIGGGGMMRGGSNSDGDASKISTWVEQNFTEQTIDGVTMYDLTKSK